MPDLRDLIQTSLGWASGPRSNPEHSQNTTADLEINFYYYFILFYFILRNLGYIKVGLSLTYPTTYTTNHTLLP